MSEHEKPLPTPPNRRRFQETDKTPLTADRMAEAMAEGRLEEFIEKEIPDNDYARNLVSMMMAATGMMPGGVSQGRPEKQAAAQDEQGSTEKPPSAPPEDVFRAAASGDMEGLMGLLRKEHAKRSGENEAGNDEPSEPLVTDQSAEKEIIEQLIRISSENSVTMDWVIFRALKLYVSEYRSSGRL
jgi:hypothetical protein